MATPLYDTDVIPVGSRPLLTVLDGGDYFVVLDVSSGKLSRITKESILGSPAIDIDNTGYTITIDQILHNTASTLEQTVVGSTAWNDANKTLATLLENDVTLLHGMMQLVPVVNTTGATIPAGSVVRYAGTQGASGRILVALAHGGTDYQTDATYHPRKILGILPQELANNGIGYAIQYGKYKGFDTSDYSAGDILYLSPDTDGALTSTLPTGQNLKVPIGVVISSAVNGTLGIEVFAGMSFEDIHDLDTSGKADGRAILAEGNGHVYGKVLHPSDIVDDLTTGGTTVPLSAEQGKTLYDNSKNTLLGTDYRINLKVIGSRPCLELTEA